MPQTFMSSNRTRLSVFATAVAIVYALACMPSYSQNPSAELHGQVVDEDSQPIARVEIAESGSAPGAGPVYTDAAGRFVITFSAASSVRLKLSKPGFFRIDDRSVDLAAGVNEITFTLNHEKEFEQSINVQSPPIQIDSDTTSHQETLVQHEILDTPTPPSNDLQKNLVIMPQAVIDAAGRLHIAGARQGQTEVLLDGFEINNPGTGAFDSRVNVDAVQGVSAETGGYGAEYAHASAGVLEINTQSGDDRLRFGITNFVPGLNFQRGVKFGIWTPRVTVSGPLKKGKAWFSEALSSQRIFHLVTELPNGQNGEVQWSDDNLLRGDINLSSTNTLHASFLYNRASDARQGLGAYSPASTTTDSESHRYFISLKDQIWIGHTLFETGAAFDTGIARNTPNGDSNYVVAPSSSSGNYFQSLRQDSQRLQWFGNITTSQLHWFGEHTISEGWNLAGLDFSQNAARSEIEYVSAANTLIDQATFSGPASLRMANTQVGGYIQDHWRPFTPLAFSAGVRVDWDRLIQRSLAEPRFALNWVPAREGNMKFTLAWGVHYQPLNLSIFSQGFDQQRNDQFYNSAGTAPVGPPIVTTFNVPLGRLVQPRSYNTMAEWEEKVSSRTFVGASFLMREVHQGFAYELTTAPATFTLANHRSDSYVAGEIWLHHSFSDKAQIKIDYTVSRASSTQVLDPSLTQLIFSAQQSGPLPWDARHRIISTGWTPLPIWQLFLSGFFEYHTGFPFSAINVEQQLVGAANSLRFPAYISLDLGLEKRFHFRGHEWAIRISSTNITEHNNPDRVVNRVDAPDFLTYAGGQTRIFSGRIRLVTSSN